MNNISICYFLLYWLNTSWTPYKLNHHTHLPQMFEVFNFLFCLAACLREVKEIRPGKISRDFDKWPDDAKKADGRMCFVVFYGSDFKLKTLSVVGMFIVIFLFHLSIYFNIVNLEKDWDSICRFLWKLNELPSCGFTIYL